MYDVAALIDVFDDFEDVYNSYMAIVETEINYRGLDISANEVLMDTIDTAACIAGRGQIGNEYPMYLAGIKVFPHIYMMKDILLRRRCNLPVKQCILLLVFCENQILKKL